MKKDNYEIPAWRPFRTKKDVIDLVQNATGEGTFNYKDYSPADAKTRKAFEALVPLLQELNGLISDAQKKVLLEKPQVYCEWFYDIADGNPAAFAKVVRNQYEQK